MVWRQEEQCTVEDICPEFGEMNRLKAHNLMEISKKRKQP